MVLKKSVLYLCSIFFFISCADENVKKEDTRLRFVSSETSGIDFNNKITSSKELNILNYLYFYNGAGIAAADFNNDGLVDLYFAANMGHDKLYLNLGDLKFREVSKSAGILQIDSWSTGVTTVDINNDGLLDLYVCEVGNYKSLKGFNKLYINQGINSNGIPQFSEESASYNLDFRGMSTQAAFFDYDLDGDLDMFLMNHSVHPNSNYGIGENRKKNDSISGDRLFRNDRGTFIDVSAESGIYSSKIGYGLGLAIGDLNNDGYPDMYVGNDFFENDYLYLNQKDGSFKDQISKEKSGIGHTSHYSMGVDIADFNNDGLQDVVSLDMLPEDLTTYKASGTDYSYQIYNNYLNKGYANQYMQNALQLNQDNVNFSEIAHIAGVAATEWSWAPLFADLDNDGNKDLFVTNGIVGATNDMDYISFVANEKIQKRLSKGMTDMDMKMIEDIPEKKTPNYFFRNKGSLEFENMNGEWINPKNSFSNGAIYADLDNDGDLELVTNNVNDEAYVYENLSRDIDRYHYLKFKFEGPKFNRFGIGAKLTLYTSNGIQTQENYPTRGYLSSVPPNLHFGLGDLRTVDSIDITWPGKTWQRLYAIEADQTLIIDFKNGKKFKALNNENTDNRNDLMVSNAHREYSFKDFTYEPLIPYSQSNLGPSVAVIDFNKDELDDIFFSGDQFKPGTFWIQEKNGNFTLLEQPEIGTGSAEPVDQVFFDLDNDDDLDLVIVYGGSDPNNINRSQPELYVNENGNLKKTSLLEKFDCNASVVRTADFNNDGFQDIFIASNSGYGSYGKSVDAVMLINEKGAGFRKTKGYINILAELGLVYDASIVDLDKNGLPDIVLAGHYMPVTMLLNSGDGNFVKKEIRDTEGWWNTIAVEDIDGDGDYDIIAGNWGLNSRLKATLEKPMQLYLNDFDNNGRVDPILTYFDQGRETPLATKDELSKQIPQLNKSFLSYSDFAKADFKDYFSKEKVDQAEKKKVVTLETTLFKNNGNLNFSKSELPREVQISSVHAILLTDLDGDGLKDLIIGGNNYHVNTQLGRQDASKSLILKNNGNLDFGLIKDKLHINGAVKSIKNIEVQNENHLIFGINNSETEFVKYPRSND